MSDEVVYSFALDGKTKRRLEELAEEGHRTLASQIRMVIEEWLDKQK